MDYISDIEQELKRVAHTLYENPRIKTITLSCETMMGCSVSYLSSGDPDSPYCKSLYHTEGLAEAKYLDEQEKLRYNPQNNVQDNNAIQNNTRPATCNTKATKESQGDIQGGLQQWL